MDLTTALVCLAVVVGIVYVTALALKQDRDFEAGGGVGTGHFFVKTKPRRK